MKPFALLDFARGHHYGTCCRLLTPVLHYSSKSFTVHYNNDCTSPMVQLSFAPEHLPYLSFLSHCWGLEDHLHKLGHDADGCRERMYLVITSVAVLFCGWPIIIFRYASSYCSPPSTTTISHFVAEHPMNMRIAFFNSQEVLLGNRQTGIPANTEPELHSGWHSLSACVGTSEMHWRVVEETWIDVISSRLFTLQITSLMYCNLPDSVVG